MPRAIYKVQGKNNSGVITANDTYLTSFEKNSPIEIYYKFIKPQNKICDFKFITDRYRYERET